MKNIVLNFRTQACNSTSSAIELGKKTGDFSLAERMLKVKQDSNSKKSAEAHSALGKAIKEFNEANRYITSGNFRGEPKTYEATKGHNDQIARYCSAVYDLKQAKAKVDKCNLRDTELQYKAKQLNDARIDFKNNIELVSGQDLINESGINILNKYNASDIRDLKS